MNPVSGLLLGGALAAAVATSQQPLQPTPAGSHPVRARYLITVADDYVVDVYHNGRAVPDARRHLLQERFGATVERVDEEVGKGDWLVFNVVNNRMRWGGAYYFAVAGCFARDEFGFVSRLDDTNWSACDTPRDVDRFISQRAYLQHRPVEKVAQPWAEGPTLIKEYAGNAWDGVPVWGASRNTWIKVAVE